MGSRMASNESPQDKDNSSDDDDAEVVDMVQRNAMIREKIAELDRILSERGVEEPVESTPQNTMKGEGYVDIVIGTSALVKVPGMVQRIDEVASGSKRLGSHEVMRRLAMGDDGLQANRVLHLAFTKTDGELVGCMSSTYQPPWTEHGCGHWGLLAVDPTHQGKGVASALVRAGERRLAAVCDEIQIEYRHTVGNADCDRLYEWYENRLEYRCDYGPPSGRPGSTDFRRCRKLIPDKEQQAGQQRRLREVREYLVEQLREEDEMKVDEAQPEAT